MSNLKQLSLGIMQYTQDYDEKMPACKANDLNGVFLYHRIDPYVKSKQVFVCPSDSVNSVFSYGYNYVYLALTPTQVISIAQINSPSQTVMLTDKTANDNSDWVYSPQSWTSHVPTDPDDTHGNVSVRHLEGTNVAWADGHVKWQKIAAIDGPGGCTGAACDVWWDLS